jgi:hypothetical protein
MAGVLLGGGGDLVFSVHVGTEALGSLRIELRILLNIIFGVDFCFLRTFCLSTSFTFGSSFESIVLLRTKKNLVDC